MDLKTRAMMTKMAMMEMIFVTIISTFMVSIRSRYMAPSPVIMALGSYSSRIACICVSCSATSSVAGSRLELTIISW